MKQSVPVYIYMSTRLRLKTSRKSENSTENTGIDSSRRVDAIKTREGNGRGPGVVHIFF